MKGEFVLGGLKDPSESLLRAFGGSPRCPLVGEIDFTYNFNVVYGSGGLIHIHPAVGFPNPPQGFPFGKWDLTTTAVIINPIAASFRLSVAQLVGATSHTLAGSHSRYLVTPSSWDQVTLQSGQNAVVDFPPSGWVLADGSGGHLNVGPDLAAVASIDLGTAGTFISEKILPEQSEFCLYQFYPYLFTDLFTIGELTAQHAWSTSGIAEDQIAGWELAQAPNGAYPNGTLLATFAMRFRRISNTPLFISAITPPATFHFTNLSLFNPSLVPTWDWDFGDGSGHVSTFNSSHTYAANKKYTITLKATDPIETKSFTQTVDLSLKANFTYNARQTTSGGVHVSQVTFTNTSNGGSITTYDWDFGDGSAHGTTANPVHNYPVSTYPIGTAINVTLTIGDGVGTATIAKPVITA